MKRLIWLDDLRDHNDTKMNWLAFSPIGKEVEVNWVKNKIKFVKWIHKNGLPDDICFDHDLGENESTGYYCVKWLVEYCLDNKY